MVKKELNNLVSLSKIILPRKIRKKIKNVKDLHERINLYKHAIKSVLEIEIHNLEMLIKEKGKRYDVFHFITKTNLLNLKIKYFIVSYDKRDFKKIKKEIKEVDSGLKKLE